MKKLERLKNLLEANYNLKGNKYKYFPKTHDELKNLVDDLIAQYGRYVDLNIINVSNIDDFSDIFYNYNKFNGDVTQWDVSNGKTFSGMFVNCYNFSQDLSKWDVSNSQNFAETFFSCSGFESDLSKWDVSNVKYFPAMFYGCNVFNSNLSRWDVSNGIDFREMFYECYEFTADLSRWNVKRAKKWDDFATGSALEDYPERIPAKFRSDYL
jgi:surface protein